MKYFKFQLVEADNPDNLVVKAFIMSPTGDLEGGTSHFIEQVRITSPVIGMGYLLGWLELIAEELPQEQWEAEKNFAESNIPEGMTNVTQEKANTLH